MLCGLLLLLLCFVLRASCFIMHSYFTAAASFALIIAPFSTTHTCTLDTMQPFLSRDALLLMLLLQQQQQQSQLGTPHMQWRPQARSSLYSLLLLCVLLNSLALFFPTFGKKKRKKVRQLLKCALLLLLLSARCNLTPLGGVELLHAHMYVCLYVLSGFLKCITLPYGVVASPLQNSKKENKTKLNEN